MKSHATCSARSAAVRRGKSFSTLKKQDDQIAATNVNQSHLIKLERIKLLEAKEKAKLELPHLYGQKFYPWSREFFESTHPMVLMTKGNQVGGSSVQIRKMIHWATDPDIRKSVFGKDPNEQLLFLYFMPSLNLFARLAPFGAIGEDACTLSDDTAAHLGVHEGDDVWLLPLE